jgi:hypothetical protein
MVANRLARIREKILASQLDNVMGRQLRISEGSRPGFGSKVSVVADQDAGGAVPIRMPLNNSSKAGERNGK